MVMSTQKITLLVFLLFSSSMHAVNAEVVTDGSVGDQGVVAVAGPDYQIDANVGEVKGDNLYHSFSRFNIETDSSATFTANDYSDGAISNIIARVSGARSFVNGEIGSDINGANLWLLNPNGVIFGDQASINLTGSFYLSAGQGIGFADNTILSASTSRNALSSSTPVSFILNANANGLDIHARQLDAGTHSITLAGGYINVMNSTITANKMNLQSGANIVVRNDFSVPLSDPGIAGNITTHGSNFNIGNGQGEGIIIRAGKIELNDSSISLVASNGDGMQLVGDSITLSGHSATDADSIRVVNTDSDRQSLLDVRAKRLLLKNAAQVSLYGAADKPDSDANINIVTDSLLLDNAYVTSHSETGNILIMAENIKLTNESLISSHSDSSGNAGSISLDANTISLQQSRIESTVGTGNGGDIALIAAREISLQQGSKIVSSAQSGGEGGNIRIRSEDVYIIENSQVKLDKSGSGKAGFLTMYADDRIGIQQSTILASGGGTVHASGSITEFEARVEGAIPSGIRSEEQIPGAEKPITITEDSEGAIDVEIETMSSSRDQLSDTVTITAAKNANQNCISIGLPGAGNRGYFLEKTGVRLGDQNMDLMLSENINESPAGASTGKGVSFNGVKCP